MNDNFSDIPRHIQDAVNTAIHSSSIDGRERPVSLAYVAVRATIKAMKTDEAARNGRPYQEFGVDTGGEMNYVMVFIFTFGALVSCFILGWNYGLTHGIKHSIFMISRQDDLFMDILKIRQLIEEERKK